VLERREDGVLTKYCPGNPRIRVSMGKKPLKMVSQSVLEPLTVLLPALLVEFVEA